MNRVLIYAGLLGCVVFVAHAEQGDAQAFEGGCPSVEMTVCKRVDLSEVCGPGCYVDLIGRMTDE